MMPAAPAAALPPPASDADTQVIGILEFTGLRRCPHPRNPQQIVFCGCAPGRCQSERIVPPEAA